MAIASPLSSQTSAADGRDLFQQLLVHVELPFRTEVLGVQVDVIELESDAVDRVTAVCVRGENRLRIPLQDLLLPSPPPAGAEWIAAWCRWHDGVEAGP